ncbi:MAG: hypothetical protein EBR13_03950 [Rhodobacteraceae bacterium]|nr:hypothetical protein [Paracoccaceae bacterium]
MAALTGPAFTALSRPMMPTDGVLELPNGLAYHAWAVAQPRGSAGFAATPILNATMLLRPLHDAKNVLPQNALPIGSGCHVCPRDACAARRVPSVLA